MKFGFSVAVFGSGILATVGMVVVSHFRSVQATKRLLQVLKDHQIIPDFNQGSIARLMKSGVGLMLRSAVEDADDLRRHAWEETELQRRGRLLQKLKLILSEMILLVQEEKGNIDALRECLLDVEFLNRTPPWGPLDRETFFTWLELARREFGVPHIGHSYLTRWPNL